MDRTRRQQLAPTPFPPAFLKNFKDFFDFPTLLGILGGDKTEFLCYILCNNGCTSGYKGGGRGGLTEKIKWLLWQRQQYADRNLPAYEVARHKNMLRYGFGPEVMKQIKVCGTCGKLNDAWERKCRECGARLPRNTLFDRYREMHKCCPVCKTVISEAAGYCPICGKKQPKSKTQPTR